MDKFLYPLRQMSLENLYIFRRKTVTAIWVLVGGYILGIILFVIIYLCQATVSAFSLLPPFIAYLWIITFGSNHVNNRYGFKRKKEGDYLYMKNRERYSTFAWIWVILYMITSLVRIGYEIYNLSIISRQIKLKERIGG